MEFAQKYSKSIVTRNPPNFSNEHNIFITHNEELEQREDALLKKYYLEPIQIEEP